MSASCRPTDERVSAPAQSQTRSETLPPRGLVDRDSFARLQPAAQATLLRQTLLLYLTALELANRNPDDWEAAAFAAALDHLVAKAPLKAYDEIRRMLLPAPQRAQQPAATRAATTGILRVEMGGDGPRPLPEKLDRNGMRRRLLQLSAIQLPPLHAAEAPRSVPARTSRRHAASTGAESPGD